MESVIAQGIQLLLPYQSIRQIAFEILWNYHQSTTKVASLQVLSLKIIMKKKVKKSDRPAKVFYRVLFKEYQDLEKFTDRCTFRKKWKNVLSKIVYSVQDFFTGYQKTHKIYQKLRANPHLMLAILDQQLDEGQLSSIQIIIKRNSVEICTLFYHLVAEIPHRNGVEYDTHWADVFARFAFSKRLYGVLLKIQGDEDVDFFHLFNHMFDWMDSIEPKIPEEGWKEAIESGNRRIYGRYSPEVSHSQKSVAQYFFVKKEYNPIGDHWGYL